MCRREGHGTRPGTFDTHNPPSYVCRSTCAEPLKRFKVLITGLFDGLMFYLLPCRCRQGSPSCPGFVLSQACRASRWFLRAVTEGEKLDGTLEFSRLLGHIIGRCCQWQG